MCKQMQPAPGDMLVKVTPSRCLKGPGKLHKYKITGENMLKHQAQNLFMGKKAEDQTAKPRGCPHRPANQFKHIGITDSGAFITNLSLNSSNLQPLQVSSLITGRGAQTFQHLARRAEALHEGSQLWFLCAGKGKPITPHLPQLLTCHRGQRSPRQEPTQPHKIGQRH